MKYKHTAFWPMRYGMGWICALLMALSLFLIVSAPVQAQTLPEITVDSLTESASGIDDRNDDISREIFHGLLGSFADEPLKASVTPDAMLGEIFLVFNVALFTVGVAFMTYTIIISIAVSAHEGEVMGKRMSSFWVPIRYAMGIFGMVPVFGGFSLAQAIMMFIAILGIGMANLVADKAIKNTSDFSLLSTAPVFAGHNAITSINADMAKDIFAMNVCSLAAGNYKSWLGLVDNPPKIEVTSKGLEVLGSHIACGSIDIVDETSTFLGFGDGQLRNDSGIAGMAGFRNNGVDYASVNKAAKEIAKTRETALKKLQEIIQPIAQSWFSFYQNGDSTFFDAAAIAEAAADTSKEEMDAILLILTSLEEGEKQSIKSNVLEGMKEGGWMGLGAWYSMFAEANAAIQSAVMATHYKINPPDLNALNVDEATKGILQKLYSDWHNAELKADSCLLFLERNPAGSCTPAQSLFIGVMDSVISDTGGENLINPIIATKNIGDWMLTVVGTLAGTAALLDTEAAQTIAKRVPLMETFTKGITGVVKGDGDGMLTSLASLLISISLILGITFAVYVPFVPFLTWFSALVSYFASVLEGLVAAQVWAFSHLHTEGEGMGHKADRGYLFILNMLLRPTLMIFGFFFAGGILTLLGTAFFQLFGPALANVQGNTMTGPFIMVGLMAIVGLTLLTMIQTVFNLIYEIPDRVIAWFGGGMEARMAKEMDQGIERGAKTVANWTGGTAFTSIVGGSRTR